MGSADKFTFLCEESLCSPAPRPPWFSINLATHDLIFNAQPALSVPLEDAPTGERTRSFQTSTVFAKLLREGAFCRILLCWHFHARWLYYRNEPLSCGTRTANQGRTIAARIEYDARVGARALDVDRAILQLGPGPMGRTHQPRHDMANLTRPRSMARGRRSAARVRASRPVHSGCRSARVRARATL